MMCELQDPKEMSHKDLNDEIKSLVYPNGHLANWRYTSNWNDIGYLKKALRGMGFFYETKCSYGGFYACVCKNGHEFCGEIQLKKSEEKRCYHGENETERVTFAIAALKALRWNAKQEDLPASSEQTINLANAYDTIRRTLSGGYSCGPMNYKYLKEVVYKKGWHVFLGYDSEEAHAYAACISTPKYVLELRGETEEIAFVKSALGAILWHKENGDLFDDTASKI